MNYMLCSTRLETGCPKSLAVGIAITNCVLRTQKTDFFLEVIVMVR